MGRGVWGRMDTCICMAKFLHCSLETITMLLIIYTPIQNKKFKVWDKKKLWYIYIHTQKVECYSDIKNSKIMPFAATQTELDIVILSEVRGEIYIPYM